MRETLTRLLGSWWLFTALVLSCLAAFLFYSFGENPSAQWMGFAFHHPLGIALYIGLIANLLFATLRIARSSLQRAAPSPDRIQSMDAWVSIPLADARTLEQTAQWMEGKGFPPATGGKGLRSLKGKWSFLPGTVMRIGAIITMIAVLFSVNIRKADTITLHEGQEITLGTERITVRTIDPRLPSDFLQVGDESGFLLEQVRATLTVADRVYTLSTGFPTKAGEGYLRIVNLEYAQPMTVLIQGRATQNDVNLDVLPPGKTQLVPLVSKDTFLTFSLEPEKTINKGLLKGKQFNLVQPFYRVVIQQGAHQNKPYTATLRPGGQLSRGALSLALGKNRPAITIQSVRDPSLPWIYFGVAATLTGLTLMLSRFFWYRKELAAVIEKDSLYLGYQEEYFKKWGILNFHEWKEELERE